MRALLPLVGVATLALAGLRVWIAYRRPPEVRSRRARIIRVTIDVYLIVLAIVLGLALLAVLITTLVQAISNV